MRIFLLTIPFLIACQSHKTDQKEAYEAERQRLLFTKNECNAIFMDFRLRMSQTRYRQHLDSLEQAGEIRYDATGAHTQIHTESGFISKAYISPRFFNDELYELAVFMPVLSATHKRLSYMELLLMLSNRYHKDSLFKIDYEHMIGQPAYVWLCGNREIRAMEGARDDVRIFYTDIRGEAAKAIRDQHYERIEQKQTRQKL